MSLQPVLPPTARLILRTLASAPDPMTPVEIATATDSSGITVERLLRRLQREGLVNQSRVGMRIHYSLTIEQEELAANIAHREHGARYQAEHHTPAVSK